MTDQVKTGIREDELVQPEREDFEVVNGEWVEIADEMMTLLHTLIIDNLVEILKPFLRKHKLGIVHSEGPKYVLHVDENGIKTAYKPDLAFLRKGRIPEGFDLYRRPFPGAPDLAVEVISPSDVYSEVEEKVSDWLDGGAQMVIVVNSRKRSVTVYRSLTEIAILTEKNVVDGKDVVPGWTLPVELIFQL